MSSMKSGWARSLAAVVVLATIPSAWADELPRAEPRALGFSAERLDYIDKFYSDEVKKGDLAGIVLLVARHGKVAHFSAVGYADIGKQQRLRTDTIFRLYSMTKPIAATALMMLYEEGKFQLDDPISQYIPEFKGVRVLRTPDSPLTDTVPATREPTLHDLFRHTAGLMHGGEPGKNAVDAAYIRANLFGLDTPLAEMIERLAKIPLRYQPGTKFEYSVGQDVQARLVEIFSGMPFYQFLEQRLFEPLGMKDCSYWVKDASRLAAVHWSKKGKLVPCDDAHGCPDARDDFLLDASNINSYTTVHAHEGGSYGLVGTTEDYWRFAQAMLDGGQFQGHRILSPSTVHYIAQDHLPPGVPAFSDSSGMGWGLGFAVLKDPAAAGFNGTEGQLFWGGAANTLFWIDPKNDIVVVAMTQHMDAPNIPPLWAQVRALVYAALIE